MLIKRTDKKGNAIAYTPEESFIFATERAVSSNNTLDKIYWVKRGTIKKDKFLFHPFPDGTWECIAEGTAEIGYTDAKTDRFFEPKKYWFKVQYKPTKDHLGMPDIGIVAFELEKL